MKLCCIADIHGNLVDIPDCDALLIAGDITPAYRKGSNKLQQMWIEDQFAPWLMDLALRRIKVIGIAGNHDSIFQETPHLVPKALDWIYLQDSGVIFNGVKIYGSPWQPTFYDWSFNLPESELKEKWELIPEDADIVITHGPCYGICDYTPYGAIHNAGSYTLRDRMAKICPRIHLSGHLHSGNGYKKVENTTYINASLCDETYVAKQPMYMIVTNDWSVLTCQH